MPATASMLVAQVPSVGIGCAVVGEIVPGVGK